MRIGLLGTGMVGKGVGTRLVEVGHEVRMGSRTADNPDAASWAASAGDAASTGTFTDAAAFGELVINATGGGVWVNVLEAAGAENLEGKVLLDIANPLDFSGGMPPTLSICNDDSLGEQIQRAYPGVRVVKSLNTMAVEVMVRPDRVAGVHNVFVCGNDEDAKGLVCGLLEQFGWPSEAILDLGDISAARGTEMFLPLWLRLWSATGSRVLNIAVVKGD